MIDRRKFLTGLAGIATSAALAEELLARTWKPCAVVSATPFITRRKNCQARDLRISKPESLDGQAKN